MKLKFPRMLLYILLVAAALFSGGCATGRNTVIDTNVRYEAKPDQALVVFLRPSNFAYAISSTVWDSTGNQNRFIAALGPKEKISYYCAPGDHLFMVIAENADFMEAKLEAGKIYYAVVTPRMGVWKARFSLHPIKADHPEKEFNLSSPEIRQWLAECHYVRPTEDVIRNQEAKASTDVQERRAEYAGKWAAMLEKDKQWRRALPTDGVTTPLN